MTKTSDPIEISLTAVRAKRHNLERECEDAMVAAAAPFRERIAELNRAEAALEPLVANGDGPAAAAGPPRKQRGGGRRRPKTSTRAKRTPAAAPRRADKAPPADAPSAEAKSGQRGRAVENREAALAFIREHPGCRQAEVVAGTSIPNGSIVGVINSLTRSKQGAGLPAVRIEHVGPREKRLYAQSADLLPANDEGVKTGDEQKVIDVLVAADAPLPPGEVSLRSGIRSDHVPRMLQRLAERRVIDRLPPKRDGHPPRYRPGSGTGDRSLEAAIEDAVA